MKRYLLIFLFLVIHGNAIGAGEVSFSRLLRVHDNQEMNRVLSEVALRAEGMPNKTAIVGRLVVIQRSVMSGSCILATDYEWLMSIIRDFDRRDKTTPVEREDSPAAQEHSFLHSWMELRRGGECFTLRYETLLRMANQKCDHAMRERLLRINHDFFRNKPLSEEDMKFFLAAEAQLKRERVHYEKLNGSDLSGGEGSDDLAEAAFQFEHGGDRQPPGPETLLQDWSLWTLYRS